MPVRVRVNLFPEHRNQRYLGLPPLGLLLLPIVQSSFRLDAICLAVYLDFHLFSQVLCLFSAETRL